MHADSRQTRSAFQPPEIGQRDARHAPRNALRNQEQKKAPEMAAIPLNESASRYQKRSERQRGGTLLGLLLGIVLGLGMALGVALYVAKVPVPFIHKASSRSTEQDAAEAERNRDWDPNAPLHSRPASGSATPMPAARPGNAPTRPVPAPAEVQRPATAPTPTQAQQTTGSDDPLGDFIAARARQNHNAASGQTVAAASGESPFIYYVQAGAFREQAEAQAQRARLTLAGIQAQVTSHEQGGRTVYRVRVGPFQRKDAADSAKARMAGNGFEADLVRVQR